MEKEKQKQLLKEILAILWRESKWVYHNKKKCMFKLALLEYYSDLAFLEVEFGANTMTIIGFEWHGALTKKKKDRNSNILGARQIHDHSMAVFYCTTESMRHISNTASRWVTSSIRQKK